MKKLLCFALATLSTLSTLADTLKDGDRFTVNGASTNLTAAVAVGETIEFAPERNGTTGILCVAVNDDSTKPKVEINQQESPMETTCKFLKGCGHYFIATVDKDQPRVRPFGTVNIFEGKLYIQKGERTGPWDCDAHPDPRPVRLRGAELAKS